MFVNEPIIVRRDLAHPAETETAPARIGSEPLDPLLTRLTTTSAGLSTDEARRRLAAFGPNDAAAVKRTPPWMQFLARFRNPLVLILLMASGLSAAAGDIPSFLIVITIVTLSVILDFVQEFRAYSAIGGSSAG